MGKIDWKYPQQVLHTTESALEHPIEGAPERIASVFHGRAKKLANPPVPASSETSSTAMLVFRLDQERYGIELEDISAVLGTMRCTPVPESEAKLEGLMNVNGTVRPVLNLRSVLGLSVAAQNAPAHFLLLRQKQRELGLKVDEVERIASVSLQALRSPGADAVAPCIRGYTSDTLTVLHTPALFAEFWNETLES